MLIRDKIVNLEEKDEIMELWFQLMREIDFNYYQE